MIREREKFSYCVEYLDNLHPDRKLQRELEKERKRKRKEKEARDKANIDETYEQFSEETLDRYSY